MFSMRSCMVRMPRAQLWASCWLGQWMSKLLRGPLKTMVRHSLSGTFLPSLRKGSDWHPSSTHSTSVTETGRERKRGRERGLRKKYRPSSTYYPRVQRKTRRQWILWESPEKKAKKKIKMGERSKGKSAPSFRYSALNIYWPPCWRWVKTTSQNKFASRLNFSSLFFLTVNLM